MQFSEKKINFVHHHLVYTETRRKQPLPNNFSLKIFHYFLKWTVGQQKCALCTFWKFFFEQDLRNELVGLPVRLLKRQNRKDRDLSNFT